jgi:hemoglobin-like flavoprotein
LRGPNNGRPRRKEHEAVPDRDSDPVLDSFARARRNELGPKFYDTLLGASSEIAARFAHTDLKRQVQLFEHGVLMLLQFGRGDAVGQMALERLGRLHSRAQLDIHPDLYTPWLSCLVHVVSQVDPEFDDDLREQWIDLVRPGLQHMAQMY